MPIDCILSVAIIPAAHFLLLYRRIGASRIPRTTSRLKNIGVFPICNHYYEPLFDDKLLFQPLDKDRYLPGIDFRIESQLKHLDQLTFSSELASLNLDQKNGSIEAFHIGNGSFGFGDADFLYQMIRHLKPRKIIEIGSGNSTKIARLALGKNQVETGGHHEHICIEPYEQPWLEGLEGVKVVRELIESLEYDWSNELGPGDLLFVDSSHVIRPQGDVLKVYLEIIPQLSAGVCVHIHDIFTPKDYLKSWVVGDVRFWNEQYLLEALLTNTSRYEIVAALNFLKHNHYNKLGKICPYITEDCEPGSLYFMVKN
jgi:hypothetical protein